MRTETFILFAIKPIALRRDFIFIVILALSFTAFTKPFIINRSDITNPPSFFFYIRRLIDRIIIANKIDIAFNAFFKVY